MAATTFSFVNNFRNSTAKSAAVIKMPDNANLRTNINQITFAFLISVLLVADMFLVWSLGYLVIFYEKSFNTMINGLNQTQLTIRQLSVKHTKQ